MLLICVLLLKWCLRRRSWTTVLATPPDELLPSGKVPMAYRLSLAIVGSCWAIFAANLLSSYPDGWDAVHYHLPVAVRWLQQRSLAMPPSHPWKYSLPGNAEIGMMLWLGTGWQATASLFNTLAAVLTIAATYTLANRFSGDRGGASLATLVLASIPVIQFQAFLPYVDLFGASFLPAAVALFLSRHDSTERLTPSQRSMIAVFLAGCSCGIAVGTKPTYYVYGAVFLLGAVVTLWAEGMRGRRGRAAAVMTILLFAGVLIPSGFWVLRAILETGNPLYPLRVEIFGYNIFPGYASATITDPNWDLFYVRSRAEWLVYPWVEYIRVGYNYRQVRA